MLVIDKKFVDAMILLASKAHPIEVCGIIAGKEGSNTPSRFIPMHNFAQSVDFFQFDPKQQFSVWQEMDKRGEQPIVIYHSHTHSEAYPSREDIRLATEPGAHYVIIATNKEDPESVRSFRIVNGTVTEERIQIVGVHQGSLEMCLVPA